MPGIIMTEIQAYVFALVKRKNFVITCTLVPAAITALVLLIIPRLYIVSYSFELGYDQKSQVIDKNDLPRFDLGVESGMSDQQFVKFQRRFYNSRNQQLIMEKIEQLGLPTMKRKLQKAINRGQLEKVVTFESKPTYLRFQDWDNLKISDRMNPDSIKKIQELKLTGVEMVVKGYPEDEVLKTAQVLMENYQQVIPLNHLRERLNQKLLQLNQELSSIDAVRRSKAISLDNLRRNLEKLIKIRESEKKVVPINEPVLHFEDVSKSSTFLPLRYQVQAIQTEIARMEEHIKTQDELYGYYGRLSDESRLLLAELQKNRDTFYTVDKNRDYVLGLIENTPDSESELREYLQSYLRFAENLLIYQKPISESPRIYPVPKDTALITSLVALTFLILSLAAVYVLEAGRTGQ